MDQTETVTLPYYQIKLTEGRPLVLLPFYDEGEFKIPWNVRGKIVLLKPDVAYSGNYISQRQLNPEFDYYLLLLDLLVQHVTSPDLIHLIQTVVGDIINFGASIEKYNFSKSQIEVIG